MTTQIIVEKKSNILSWMWDQEKNPKTIITWFKTFFVYDSKENFSLKSSVLDRMAIMRMLFSASVIPAFRCENQVWQLSMLQCAILRDFWAEPGKIENFHVESHLSAFVQSNWPGNVKNWKESFVKSNNQRSFRRNHSIHTCHEFSSVCVIHYFEERHQPKSSGIKSLTRDAVKWRHHALWSFIWIK